MTSLPIRDVSDLEKASLVGSDVLILSGDDSTIVPVDDQDVQYAVISHLKGPTLKIKTKATGDRDIDFSAGTTSIIEHDGLIRVVNPTSSDSAIFAYSFFSTKISVANRSIETTGSGTIEPGDPDYDIIVSEDTKVAFIHFTSGPGLLQSLVLDDPKGELTASGTKFINVSGRLKLRKSRYTLNNKVDFTYVTFKDVR